MVLSDLHRSTIMRVLVVTALAGLLVACGGGADKVAAKGAQGSTSTTVAAHGLAGSDASKVASGAVGTTSTTSGAKASSGGSSPVATEAVKNAPDDTPGLPAAGRYRYHTTGTTTFGANPSQPVDQDSDTTVVHLGGGNVRQTSEGQDMVLQWSGSQVLLHMMDFTRPGFERHFEAKPAVRYAPTDLQVGQTWTWKLTATNLPTTIEQDSRVDRLETISVGGKSAKTIVIVTKITISGDVTGTIDLTTWVDIANDLPTRIHAKTNIVTFTFTSDTTSDFTGFTAA